jgi:hypothetical protein
MRLHISYSVNHATMYLLYCLKICTGYQYNSTLDTNCALRHICRWPDEHRLTSRLLITVADCPSASSLHSATPAYRQHDSRSANANFSSSSRKYNQHPVELIFLQGTRSFKLQTYFNLCTLPDAGSYYFNVYSNASVLFWKWHRPFDIQLISD